MPSIENRIDANFYELAHRLLNSLEQEDGEERRGHNRRPFVATHRVTPCREPGVPERSESLEVQCCDLTQGGFSFLLPNRPDFTSLIIAFGALPSVVCLAAEVAHCEDVLVHASGAVELVRDRAGHQDAEPQTGTPMVLVGCRFTRRLE